MQGCSLHLDSRDASVTANRLLPAYYAATLVFLVLDYAFGVNVRLTFLEPWPQARAGYYGFCFVCLALMWWRPAWIALIGCFESLVTLVALIFGMAIRVMIPYDAIFAENAQFVTAREIVNFLIAGFVAYYAWVNGLKAVIGR